MPASPLPLLPTVLPDVEVIAAVRGGAPVAVVCRKVEEDAPLLGRLELTEEWITAVGLTGKAGEVHSGPVGSPVRWVVGVGDGKPAGWRAAGAALTKAVNTRIAADSDAGRPAARTLQLELPEDAGPDEVAELVRGLRLGGYAYKVASTAAKPKLRTIRLVAANPEQLTAVEPAARRSAALAEATALTRDLANTPSNIKDPSWLARMAVKVASRVPGVAVTVHDEHWLAQQGFGGVLAVGSGSERPPRLIELHWQPPAARDAVHLVLIGKGITFDTGGISVKAAEGMHLMRTDMAGGAAVISAVVAAARFRLGIRLTGLVPCAENHLSGSAYRPGDVVRHFGGRTTEVTNTDAEGRMILADALAYATARLKPDLLVDVATLTGSMKVSLGLRTGGLFATSETLAERIIAAGERVGEAWWRMPLPDDVASLGAELLDAVPSDIADVRQCPPGPGGITAAAFLREFTDGLPWAHLDIAGPARADKPYDEVVPGATGFAARTLIELACAYAS